MLEAKFIASGSSFEEALKFSCELTAKLYLGEEDFKRSKTIDIYCDNLKQAKKLDELLWKIPKEVLLPHQLAHKQDLEEPIRIGYPGTKFLNKSNSLINISPDMPNSLDDYETYYQLVIMDGAELREKAAATWTECKKIGLTPEFLDQS
tara:strand:+ start:111 stop:557 length:447 start_codon:yes stop_codon:yes gene_type:complete